MTWSSGFWLTPCTDRRSSRGCLPCPISARHFNSNIILARYGPVAHGGAPTDAQP